ncbi:helix-turn-helix transcriptional regulator [Kitasatospora sp. NPDC001574]
MPLHCAAARSKAAVAASGSPPRRSDRYLTTEETAALIGICPKTLRNWRSQGKGPRPIRLGRIGGRVRYRLADVGTFLSLGAADGFVPGLRRVTGPRRSGV